tara:strand:+ start:617 stop:1372 length:756 start_codon:yes stop_codon:yes gene_type:complete
MDPKVAVSRATFLFFVCALLDSLFLLGIGLIVGLNIVIVLPASMVLAVIWILFVFRKVDSIILRKINAEPLPARTYPRFVNLVDGVCVAYGFRNPELYIVQDVAPNMMMVGRKPQHSSLVVTTGLLERVRRTELEGLITHELSRSRNRTSYLEGTIAILVAWPWSFLPSLVSKLGLRLIDPWVVAETDVAAVALTRYPPGLAKALENICSDGREPTHNPRFCRHMWVNPPREPLIGSSFSTNDRIAALAEL